MKLKANAGKKQSLQPKHNVVGPEKRAAWPAPCYSVHDWCQCPPTFWKKVPPFARPNHQTTRKSAENLKPTHPHHTLTTRACLFPLQIFQLQSVQHQQSKSPKELIQWHRSKSKAIHPTAITKQCHEWCHTQMGYCLDPEILGLNSRLLVVRFIFYFEHLNCVYPPPGIEFSGSCHQGDSVSVSNISSFIGLFVGFANGHAQSWSFASLNFWMWCLLDIGRRCD